MIPAGRVLLGQTLTLTTSLPYGCFSGWQSFPVSMAGSQSWMVSLFNLAWRRLEWPKDWQRAYFMPLYKGDGSQLDPDNYRLLAISSVVMKLFEKILDRRIQTWSERVGILSDLQGGFRAGRGTVDQLFILNEITAIRREQGLTTFLCFIDVSKA